MKLLLLLFIIPFIVIPIALALIGVFIGVLAVPIVLITKLLFPIAVIVVLVKLLTESPRHV